MKTLLVISFFMAYAFSLHAQQAISIGQASPHPAALFDISKTTKGFLMPRLTQTARTGINSPAEGLLVFDTTSNRMFQRQKNAWQFFLDNTYWTKNSGVANRMYSLDSIGIGNAAPSKRLDVSGNIRSRSGIIVNDDLFAANLLQGNDFISATNIVMSGQASVAGNITTQSSVNIDNSGPILQFKTGSTNMTYAQVSGDDLRLGTNSGNDAGKVIIRMNGTNIISLDTLANFKVLTASGGNISMGSKLTRQLAADDNMLPIISGRVNADGTVHSASSDVQITYDGIEYFITCFAARVGPRSSIIVTARGTAPRNAVTKYISPGYFSVQMYDTVNRVWMPTDFSFVVYDPLNLFD